MSKKQPSVANFTIHTLRLPESIDDPFQIEFKRGNTSGITEKMFADSETNEVQFEKSFKCMVTLIKNDDKHSKSKFRKKKIAFSVYRYKGNTKKVFGKFTINAAKFMKSKMETFEVESPHSKKSFVVMTVSVSKLQNVQVSGNDLDSYSEAIQLQTEKQEEWDVSDMVTPEGKERIQNFFMRREAEKNQQRSRLSDFQQVSQRETRSQRARSSRRASIDLLTQNKVIQEINDALKTDTPKKTNKMDAFLGKKERKKKVPVPLPPTEGLKNGSQNSSSPSFKLNAKKETENKTFKRYIKSLESKCWETDLPLNCFIYPKTATAVIATLKYTKILENTDNDTESSSIINDFLDKFATSVMITSLTDTVEKWYITASIIATLNKIKENNNFDESKLSNVQDRLMSTLRDFFNEILDKGFTSFKPIADSLINLTYDESKIGKLFNHALVQFRNYIQLDEKLVDFFSDEMLKYVDRYILKTILETPGQCSFQNAIQWNSINTTFSDYKHIHLTLFREIATVFMMSMVICGNPSLVDELCPHLDKKILLHLLTIQKTDPEFLVVPNDPTMFQEFFELIPGQNEPDLTEKYEGDFEQIFSLIDVSSWNTNTFDENVIDAFPFLSSP